MESVFTTRNPQTASGHSRVTAAFRRVPPAALVKALLLAACLLLMSHQASAQLPCFPPAFTTASPLTSAVTGALYTGYVDVPHGDCNVWWTLTGGALPPGLSLTAYSGGINSRGLISGIPTAVGTYTFEITYTQDAGPSSVSKTFTLAVGAGPLAIATSPNLPAGTVGAGYSQTLAASGGTPPFAWTLSYGALPAGLALSSAGVISGTPTASGASPFGVSVRDYVGATVTQAFTLTVNPVTLAVSTVSLPSAVAGTPYLQALTAIGGVRPYVWLLTSGTLPPLLTMNSSGEILGTPTTPGSWTFTAAVADSNLRAATQTFTLVVSNGAFWITSPTALPSAVTTVAYSQTLAATGGVPPYSWQVVSGTWPPGLSMTTAGVLAGTPMAPGTYAFTVKVTDSVSATATEALSLTVIAGGTLTRVGAAPQVAAGGGWDTTIWLVNRSTAPVQARVVYHRDDGGALTLPLTVYLPVYSRLAILDTVDEIVAPNTMLVVATGAVSSSVQGWADILAGGALDGFAVFRYNGGSEATVPLGGQFTTSFSMPFDQTGGYSTGVALVNLAGWQANLAVTVWDQYGNQVLAQPFPLSKPDATGGGHEAFMLSDRLPVTAGIRGIVKFQANPLTPTGPVAPLTGIGLRASPTGAFTSLPVVTP